MVSLIIDANNDYDYEIPISSLYHCKRFANDYTTIIGYIYIYIRKKPLLDIHGVLLDANWIWIIDYSILWYTMYLRCQVVPLSVLWGWVIDRPMSLNFTGRLGHSKELGQRDGPKRRYNLLPKCSNGSMGLTWQNLLVLSREWMGMGEWDHYW